MVVAGKAGVVAEPIFSQEKALIAGVADRLFETGSTLEHTFFANSDSWIIVAVDG